MSGLVKLGQVKGGQEKCGHINLRQVKFAQVTSDPVGTIQGETVELVQVKSRQIDRKKFTRHTRGARGYKIELFQSIF